MADLLKVSLPTGTTSGTYKSGEGREGLKGRVLKSETAR